ncbi:MAG TPA: FtsX-like permease family protein [Anaerolineales bacterium]|nr:FtsX-like permease family protein [Anaerolineales bacterium]
MSSAAWRKAFRDLWGNKARTLLVILALVVGVVSVGTAAVAYSILPREMDKNYLRTDPASATVWVEPVDDELVKTVAAMPQIARAEASSYIVGRFQIASGEWRELWLYVIPDFNDIQLDKFTPEQGAWPPGTGEILLERTAVGVAQAKVGEDVIVKIPNQQEQTLSFTGTVHTPGLPPAWVESRVYGYITPQTLALFGGDQTLKQLKVLVAENQFDKAAITQTAYELKDWLEENGRTVSRIDILEPGRHVHADLMAAFITMLEAMGLLALVMSGVLVTVMISAMLGQQIRQIGIMKAIGGSAGQIARIYLAMVLVLGLIALIIGLPISLALGRALADYEAVQMLNFEIFDNRVDPWVYGLIVVVGLLVPLLAAANPIIRGSRITVLAGLSDYGVGKGKFGTSRIDIWLGNLKGETRTFLLSLRNTFRRRSRLVLTLLTLTVAGANFMTAMNVSASIDESIKHKFDATPYDIEIAFSQSYPPGEIEQVVSQVNGVKYVETWGSAQSFVVLPDGTLGKPLRLTAPLIGTELSPKPPILKGRWLQPDDQNALVASDALLELFGIDAVIGEEILLDIKGQKTTWKLVGISREFMASTAYVPFDYFTQTTNYGTGTIVKTTDPNSTDQISRGLEIQLASAGFDVYTMWKTEDIREVMEEHMVLITGILLIMAALFTLIGGLGLASTMSLNVLDRTRELGIIRAIGAATLDVLQIIILEGAFIGALSWVLALLLSIPYSGVMGQVFAVLLKNPIDLTTSLEGWTIWFFTILAIASIASAFPAWNAARQPVNEVLAYE